VTLTLTPFGQTNK